MDLLLDWLEQLGIRLGLESMDRMLTSLGSPQRKLPAVLVAGTNGKGSTCGLLESAVRAAGYRTGLYTSPHVESVEERLRLDGRAIERRRLTRLVEEVVAAAERSCGEPPTYFEALTGAALLAFWRAVVDLAVLEVGLGGRLDATNLADPVLSIVTGIALDHEDRLGETLGEITREKAGIFRRGRAALAWAGNQEVREALEHAATTRGARLELVDDTVRVLAVETVASEGVAVRLATPVREYALRVPLAGEHQARNLALAVRAAELLSRDGWEQLDAEAIRSGVTAVRCPGRLERILLPSGVHVLLDAAHNPEGIAALAAHLNRLDEPFHLLFGCLQDKRAELMLPPLAERARRVVLTRPPTDRGLAPRILRPLVPQATECVDEPDPFLALDRALAGEPGLLVCCGSIYLIGPLRRALRARFGVPPAIL